MSTKQIKVWNIRPVAVGTINNKTVRREAGARLSRQGFALVRALEHEIAPPVEKEWDNTPFCHYVASGDMGEVQTKCGQGYLPAFAGVVEGDSDDDLSLSNSLLCETSRADFNAKDSTEAQ